MAAEDLVPVTLELGGKSPAIIEADANIKIAARRIALAKFANVGQTCVAPDYLLVHEQIQSEFIEELKSCLTQFFGSDPAKSESYGKIINEKRFDQLISYLDQGEIVFGGRYDRSSLFIEPTLMIHVSTESPLMTDEIFGPILPIFFFKSREEANSILQLNPDPLSVYVFTDDAQKEKSWIEGLRFGGGCVNNAAWQFTSHHLPFGVVGYNGMSDYHGRYSFKTFTYKNPS
jgi:aldehyde dehydrogenase (NAD+)